MHTKTCLITGANSGIGFETTKALATRGARIIMLCRNPQKAEMARSAIVKESGNDQIEVFIADMGKQEDLRRVGEEIRNQCDQLDVLINNAGTWMANQTFTQEGIETVFAVNHLAYVLLTHELFPLLTQSGDARIINVSSNNHFSAEIDFDNLYLNGSYSGMKSYALSKLGNVLFTYELNRRKKQPNLSVNVLNPGLVQTNIGVKHSKWWQGLIWKLWSRRGKSPQEGAETSIHLASSDEVKGISGKYWWNSEVKPSSDLSNDEAIASKLWEVSLELLSIKDFFKAS